MALNPLRDSLARAGLRSFHGGETPFRAEADLALAEFRSARGELGRKVARGDMTVKVAREEAAARAGALRDHLDRASAGYSPVSKIFLDRLVAAHNGRRKSREGGSLETLQRETNRLLRSALVEQQLQTRIGEFEGRAFVRPMAGGAPMATLDSVLAFHETASQSGDDAAQEWARRQLEGMRSRALAPGDQERIDRACDRPERLNPRIVARYVESLRSADAPAIEEFVGQAIEGRDANACSATFLMAREAPEGIGARWVRRVLDGLPSFPDAALDALRACEAEARSADADAARSRAEYASAVAEAEARFADLEAPDPDALARMARIQSRPVAEPHQPIGLALDRRGPSRDEFVAASAVAIMGDDADEAGDLAI